MQLDLTCFQYSGIIFKEPEEGACSGGVVLFLCFLFLCFVFVVWCGVFFVVVGGGGGIFIPIAARFFCFLSVPW